MRGNGWEDAKQSLNSRSFILGVCSGLRNSSERLQEEATPQGSPGKRARRGHLSYPIFSSVAQSCPTLCNPMDCSMPGLPVHHQFPEFTQTRVHRVGDAIQPSHPLSPPSPPAFNLSQHQDLFQWVSSSHQMAKVFELLH